MLYNISIYNDMASIYIAFPFSVALELKCICIYNRENIVE